MMIIIIIMNVWIALLLLVIIISTNTLKVFPCISSFILVSIFFFFSCFSFVPVLPFTFLFPQLFFFFFKLLFSSSFSFLVSLFSAFFIYFFSDSLLFIHLSFLYPVPSNSLSFHHLSCFLIHFLSFTSSLFLQFCSFFSISSWWKEVWSKKYSIAACHFFGAEGGPLQPHHFCTQKYNIFVTFFKKIVTLLKLNNIQSCNVYKNQERDTVWPLACSRLRNR